MSYIEELRKISQKKLIKIVISSHEQANKNFMTMNKLK